jgi:type VI secretion system secreted protein Hcp
MNRQLKIVISTIILGSLFFDNVASAGPADPMHTMTLRSVISEASNVTSYQFGAGLGVSSAAGGNRTVSQPSISEVTITRYVDADSPLYFRALTKRDPIGDVIIEDGDLSMELKDVIISGYSVSAAASANPRKGPQSESISLNFTRIIYSVAGGTACFDLQNSEVDC